MSQEITSELEIVQPSALEAMERAQTDVQIATAKRYPRTLSMVKKAMMEFATLDEETAASCFYTLPRQGKNIQGPSARMAEIALSCFQNMRAGSRIIANDGKTITAQGVCHDLQNNVSVSVEVKRRITDKNGKTYSEDMQVVTGNAACSIALRNAAFKVVPAALIKPIYEAAKRVAVGDAKTLSDRRIRCVEAFGKMGVSKEKLLARMEKKSVDDITLDDLEVLIGLHTAIKDGDTSIDEAFNPKSSALAEDPKFEPKPKPAVDDQVPGAEVPTQSEPPSDIPAPSAKGEQTACEREIKELRMFIKQSGFTDMHLINLWREAGVDESLSSFEEVCNASPKVVSSALKPWSKTLEMLKASVKSRK